MKAGGDGSARALKQYSAVVIHLTQRSSDCVVESISAARSSLSLFSIWTASIP